MIKHIIFDLGNVLIGFQSRKYLSQEKYGLTGEQINFILREAFQTGLWDENDRGTYTYAQIADILAGKRPEMRQILHRIIVEDIYTIFTELKQGSDFLRWCREQGYDCYYLSNFGEEGFHYVNQNFSFFQYFNGGTASYEIRSIKPEPEIYAYFLEKYALTPEECIFIDDVEKNIQAANAFSIHGIICDSHEHVFRQFEQLTGRCYVAPTPKI